MSNTYGGGQNTNINGKRFEKKHDLVSVFKTDGYKVRKIRGSKEQWFVYDPNDSHKIGLITRQQDFYRILSERFNIDYRKVCSKKYLPDDVFFNFDTKTLHIIEKKEQKIPGSVDEKLQSAPYKLHQYKKLMKNTEYNVVYTYWLSDFFVQDRYNDIRDYYEDFPQINLSYDVVTSDVL